MNNHALMTLDFDKVREALSTFAETSSGRDLARRLPVLMQVSTVLEALIETTEARELFVRDGNVALATMPELSQVLQVISIKGTRLTIPQLLEISAFVKLVERVRQALRPSDWSDLPRLTALAQRLPELNNLDDAIQRVIDIDKGDVRDNASLELSKLRSHLCRLRKQLQVILDNHLQRKESSKFLQDALVTIRNGRPVLPVRAECRSQLPGIVHGTSASGATVFVEPLATVEVNNNISTLETHEQEEINRILLELTSHVRTIRAALKEASKTLVYLDLVQAKAQLANAYTGTAPQILQADVPPEIKLTRAVHPLLLRRIAERVGLPPPRQDPVPISFELTQLKPGLLFTGPNTGGKTVALKTAGLLSLMTQSGLHIPADSESVFPVFSKIFTDIGDEQSISASLSTFSAHLHNVIRIERGLKLPALIILDELGTGTDPAEGGPLGAALLEHFLSLGALVMASTHHGMLKAWASTNKGVGTASFGFNQKTYAPTFVLSEQSTGRSMAFEMAERLGLSQAIVDRGREFQNDREKQLSKLLERLEADTRALEQERVYLEGEKQAAVATRTQANTELQQAKRQRVKDAQAFRSSLEKELTQARGQLSEIVSEARARALASNSMEQSNQDEAMARMVPLSTRLEDLNTEMMEPSKVTAENSIQQGQSVLTPFGLTGEVLRIVGEDEAEIQIGAKRVRIRASALTQSASVRDINTYVADMTSVETRSSPTELNIIGCTVDEALVQTDKFLDDALLSDHQQVRLIHGQGSGRLRTAIQIFLETHPHVARQESTSRGGATLVELKD